MKNQRALMRLKKWGRSLCKERNISYIYIPIALMGLIYLMGKCADNRVRVFHRPSEPSFSGGKILGNKGRGIYKRKEQIFVKRFEKIEMKFKNLDQKFDNITESLANIKNTLKDSLQKKSETKFPKMKIPSIKKTSTKEIDHQKEKTQKIKLTISIRMK